MENGLRPFYRMLAAKETLVVLGDAPKLPHGAAMTVGFLGGQRELAGGALRLAQRSGSDLGGLCF
jgi:lauroyl/myristoyl acyltransferase